ncbi:MAG: molybdopterin oxidoreductase family protein [Myxococcota bacterium]
MSMPDDVAYHYRTCHLCEAMCGLQIEMVGDNITAIRGDRKDTFSRGHICPKAVAIQDIQSDPDRLRTPMRRTADGWRPMTWDDALDLVTEKLIAVRSEHGGQSLGIYLGNPTVHNYGAMMFGPMFIRALGARQRFSATSVDQLPHQLVSYFMFGHQLLIPIPDLDRTEHLIIMGGNPVASNGSLMSAPDVRKRLKAIQDRGGKIVVIDPRRTETAKIADTHHFIRPGTDALLLAAMIHTLFASDRVDLRHLENFTDGIEILRDAVADFTPDAVASRTGLSADTIRALARDFADAKKAVWYGRMGVSTQEFGSVCHWLGNAMNILTGNLDRIGGAMFTRPAADVIAGIGGVRRPGHHDRWRSRVRGLPEFGGELPVATMAEEILEPGDGQIKAMVTFAGNPVLSTPNGRNLENALESLDFMVSIDMYINETTRFADVILPPTGPLERDHYDLVFHALAIRDTARYSRPILEKQPDAMHDWEILAALEERLSPQQDLASKASRAARRALGPSGILDYALRTGPYGEGVRFWHQAGLSLKRLKENPHGIDLGPLKPSLPDRLNTEDKRIALAPAILTEDLPRLSTHLNSGESDGMVLIGRRHLRSNNSWMHNYTRLVRGKDRCTLMVHPEDAERLGLTDGLRATVRSAVGEVVAPVEITDEVMVGVVSLPHGWGHGRQGTRQTIAASFAGVSINDLTDPNRLDTRSGNAALNGVPVTVTPASA